MAGRFGSLSDFRTRPYRDEDDYARMRGLLEQAFASSGPAVLMTVGDLDFWRYQVEDPDTMRTCQLWLADDGTLVGFAWASPGWTDVVFHPESRDVLASLVAWSEWHHESVLGQAGGFIRTAALESDAEHEALLARRGYVRECFMHWYHVRTLDGVPLRPAPPSGYRIATVAEGTCEAVARLNDVTRAAPPFTAHAWSRMLTAPTHRADLDLVAVTDPGTVVAHCSGWLDEANATVLIEPVGSHPAHRRRGLARALMAETLTRARTLGARTALVASAGTNEAARRAYESLGFRSSGRKWTWCKLLRGGGGC